MVETYKALPLPHRETADVPPHPIYLLFDPCCMATFSWTHPFPASKRPARTHARCAALTSSFAVPRVVILNRGRTLFCRFCHSWSLLPTSLPRPHGRPAGLIGIERLPRPRSAISVSRFEFSSSLPVAFPPGAVIFTSLRHLFWLPLVGRGCAPCNPGVSELFALARTSW